MRGSDQRPAGGDSGAQGVKRHPEEGSGDPSVSVQPGDTQRKPFRSHFSTVAPMLHYRLLGSCFGSSQVH